MRTRRLRVVEGRPWREAVICAIAPDAPYQPWHGADRVKRGDTAIIVLDTEPRTVLCSLTVGVGQDLRSKIAAACGFGNGLTTLDYVESTAGQTLADADGLGVDSPVAAALIAAVERYSYSTPEGRVGASSAAAARILLESGGRCACCREIVDLAARPEDLSVHPVTESAFAQGRDWPAALCTKCSAAMTEQAMTSVMDYVHTLYPACPACASRQTLAVSYGMPSHSGMVNSPPWQYLGGCMVGSLGRWSCGECRHSW